MGEGMEEEGKRVEKEGHIEGVITHSGLLVIPLI